MEATCEDRNYNSKVRCLWSSECDEDMNDNTQVKPCWTMLLSTESCHRQSDLGILPESRSTLAFLKDNLSERRAESASEKSGGRGPS